MSQEVTNNTLLNIISALQAHGTPEMTRTMTTIADAHFKNMEEVQRRAAEDALRMRGPMESMRHNLTLRGATARNWLSDAATKKHPRVDGVWNVLMERLHPSLHSKAFGGFDPYRFEEDVTYPQDDISKVSSGIYRVRDAWGHKRIKVIVKLDEPNFPLGWWVINLNKKHPNALFHDSMYLVTYLANEGDFFTHRHYEVYSRKLYSQGLDNLLKKYGHNPHRVALPKTAFENLLKQQDLPLTLGDYRIDEDGHLSHHDRDGVATLQPWDELPVVEQLKIVSELK